MKYLYGLGAGLISSCCSISANYFHFLCWAVENNVCRVQIIQPISGLYLRMSSVTLSKKKKNACKGSLGKDARLVT